jgi:UDP-glucose 4-epimerase
MTVLVTGGAGFVAATLVRRLLDRGRRVLAVDNLSRGCLQNLGASISRDRFSLLPADIADLAVFRTALIGHDWGRSVTEVWHLAANSDIQAGIRDPQVDLRDTFLTTFNTLILMAGLGIGRLYFASSSAIYGDHGDQPLFENIGPLLPISNYGAMKLASEAAISAAAEKFLQRALLFRFPNVVGVPATHGVIRDFILRLRQDPLCPQVVGNGTQRKAYLHVSDLVDAMLFLANSYDGKIAPFNIGPADDGVTVRFIEEQTIAVVAPEATIEFGQGDRGWVGDVPRFRYDVRRLQGLGWRLTLDSAGAVRQAIREIAQEEAAA